MISSLDTIKLKTRKLLTIEPFNCSPIVNKRLCYAIIVNVTLENVVAQKQLEAQWVQLSRLRNNGITGKRVYSRTMHACAVFV